jgi:ssDNA-specific exonuclease RecJ
LIYDIFGGEILKTHEKKGWHFYNRINGKRYDFAKSETGKFSNDNCFEDLPSNIDEIHNYFEQEQYSPFYMRFIREFEETVGLENSSPLAS